MTSLNFWKFTSRNCPKTKHFLIKISISIRKLSFGTFWLHLWVHEKYTNLIGWRPFWWNDVLIDLGRIWNHVWLILSDQKMVLNSKLAILTSSKLPQNVKMAIFDQKYYFRRVLCIFQIIFKHFFANFCFMVTASLTIFI